MVMLNMAKEIRNWRVKKVGVKGQFHRKGVKVGWRMHEVNGILLESGVEEDVKAILRGGAACKITFDPSYITCSFFSQNYHSLGSLGLRNFFYKQDEYTLNILQSGNAQK